MFQIPEEMSRCRNSYVEQGLSPMRMEVLVEDRSSCSYQSLLKDSIDALLKEAKDKFKGYDSCSTPENAELAYKKVRKLYKYTPYSSHCFSYFHFMFTLSSFLCSISCLCLMEKLRLFFLTSLFLCESIFSQLCFGLEPTMTSVRPLF